jgi:hypothetical protein
MYATIRRYVAVDHELIGVLEANASEVEAAMRQAPGFVGFELVRTRDGMLAVIVAEDEMSALNVDRRGAAWIQAHLSGSAPQTWDVLSGEVLVHAAAEPVGEGT